jgi:hypothetical protein
MVELKIESNSGNKEFTCVYKFKVHGDLYRAAPAAAPTPQPAISYQAKTAASVLANLVGGKAKGENSTTTTPVKSFASILLQQSRKEEMSF